MPSRALLAFIIAVASCSRSVPSPAPDPSAAVAPSNDPAAARAAIAAGAIVLDVRTAEEYAEGHLPEAINLPVQELTARTGEIEQLVAGDRTRAIVVYCGTGKRAGKAKVELEAKGYSQVINGGGLDDLR